MNKIFTLKTLQAICSTNRHFASITCAPSILQLALSLQHLLLNVSVYRLRWLCKRMGKTRRKKTKGKVQSRHNQMNYVRNNIGHSLRFALHCNQCLLWIYVCIRGGLFHAAMNFFVAIVTVRLSISFMGNAIQSHLCQCQWHQHYRIHRCDV